MRVDKGYKDMDQPAVDHNIYLLEQDCPTGQPVTRVLPDCSHPYYYSGHESKPGLERRLYRRCEIKIETNELNRKLEARHDPHKTPQTSHFLPVCRSTANERNPMNAPPSEIRETGRGWSRVTQ